MHFHEPCPPHVRNVPISTAPLTYWTTDHLSSFSVRASRSYTGRQPREVRLAPYAPDPSSLPSESRPSDTVTGHSSRRPDGAAWKHVYFSLSPVQETSTIPYCSLLGMRARDRCPPGLQLTAVKGPFIYITSCCSVSVQTVDTAPCTDHRVVVTCDLDY